MITITVLYPSRDGGRFDFDYYASTHLPMVSSSFEGEGLTEVRGLRGQPGPDGAPAPFAAIALIGFDSPESLQKARASEKMGPILADIANFTDLDPVMQVNLPI